MDWHSLEIQNVLNNLCSKDEGLGDQEVKKRLEEYGPNEITEKKRLSLVRIFIRQFFNPLIWILLAAAVLKFFLASLVDGVVILLTILFMVIIAFFQEAKAEKTMKALKNLTSPQAKVKRAGALKKIPSQECVPGDLVVLEAGDRIPADARLLQVSNFQVNEASLTGESLPIEKNIDPIPRETQLADRKNMVYTGTVVSHGKALAVICATGMMTEFGKIAEQLQKSPKQLTPLQESVKRLGHWMLVVIMGIVLGFLGIGTYLEMDWIELFILCVAIAVAAIPEGLPATVTVVLAAGVHRLSKKKGIIRKLLAVETLGATNVICSDKTGTLTLNLMTLVEVSTLNHKVSLERERFQLNDSTFRGTEDPDLLMALKIGALCNDAAYVHSGDQVTLLGDPTEVAILQAFDHLELDKTSLDEGNPREEEIPFSSELQWMATLNSMKEGKCLLMKGSPEKILTFCTHLLKNGEVEKLSKSDQDAFHHSLQEMAQRGLRVLATAYKPLASEKFDENTAKKDLIFAGFLGMIDPPREEAKLAIEKCKQAGITVKMITGDNHMTAEAIAKQLNLNSDGVVTGRQLDELSDEALRETVRKTHIFARIEPLHKLRIVHACKALKQLVGMTGDGVNDAPALEAADIGISMGITGTDVAKESSDIILTDDNFATIVDCVEEGRVIFNRLRHVTAFLLTTCFGEVITILLAFLTFHVSPLEPLQILWINLVTGSMIAIPIGMEPKEGDELIYPPRGYGVGMIFPGMVLRIIYLSIALSIGAFLIFYFSLNSSDLTHARSMTFCSIVLYEWFMALQMRSDERSAFQLSFFKNKMLNISSLIALSLLILILYVPVLEQTFMTTFLTWQDWIFCVLPGCSILILEAVRKKFFPKLFAYGKWQKGTF
ncbi:cation-translocating P-type ATPase [Simkania sp.]|uniref:cation-translocating P-type ATPase n=1 Tax=Simkania sp. TaxID=34094 RepID=UPI003B5273BE